MIDPATLRVHDDAGSMARAAAEWLCRRACEGSDRVAICLAGGTTPRRVYELLAEPALRDRFPWRRVHWFWGDERFVPHDSPDSNFGMASAAMLANSPAPSESIHPFPTDGVTSADGAAAAYERTLKDFYGSDDLQDGRPLFDVAILGLGEDGHIASLFPGSPALDERTSWAKAVFGSRPEPRLTLTFPALESSRRTMFLVAGAAKQPAVAAVRRGDHLPATRLKPAGSVDWFADRAAAGPDPVDLAPRHPPA